MTLAETLSAISKFSWVFYCTCQDWMLTGRCHRGDQMSTGASQGETLRWLVATTLELAHERNPWRSYSSELVVVPQLHGSHIQEDSLASSPRMGCLWRKCIDHLDWVLSNRDKSLRVATTSFLICLTDRHSKTIPGIRWNLSQVVTALTPGLTFR